MSQQDKELVRAQLKEAFGRRPNDLDVRSLNAAWYEQVRAGALQRASTAPSSDAEDDSPKTPKP